MERIAVFGNAGSGKTYLSQKLGLQYGLPTVDLDTLFWMPPGQYELKRPEDQLNGMVEELGTGETWIVEGVYGELVLQLLGRAQLLIWLDLPWQVCRERIESRQRKNCGPVPLPGVDKGWDTFMAYAGGYMTRDDHRSHQGHQKIFDDFDGHKVHLTSELGVNEFIERPLAEFRSRNRL